MSLSPLLTIPYGTPAIYVNLTSAFGGSSDTTNTTATTTTTTLEFKSATHNNEVLVQNAVLVRRHGVVVLFFHHHHHHPQTTTSLQGDVIVHITGTNKGSSSSSSSSSGGGSCTAIFRIHVEPNHLAEMGLRGPVKGYASLCGSGSSSGSSSSSSSSSSSEVTPHFSADPVVDDKGRKTMGAALELQRLGLDRDINKLRGRVVDLNGSVLMKGWEGPLGEVMVGRKDKFWQVSIPPPITTTTTTTTTTAVMIPLGDYRGVDHGWRHGRFEIVPVGTGQPPLLCVDFLVLWGNITKEEVEVVVLPSPPPLPHNGTDGSSSSSSSSSSSVPSMEEAKRYRKLWEEEVAPSGSSTWVDIRMVEGGVDEVVAPAGGRRRHLRHTGRHDNHNSLLLPLLGGGHYTTSTTTTTATANDFDETSYVESSLEESLRQVKEHPGYLPPDLWWYRLVQTMMEYSSSSNSGSSHTRRRLLDTFGESLIYVNRMYHQAFGREQRKVPAHMPHMIDKDVVAELQVTWKEGEWWWW